MCMSSHMMSHTVLGRKDKSLGPWHFRIRVRTRWRRRRPCRRRPCRRPPSRRLPGSARSNERSVSFTRHLGESPAYAACWIASRIAATALRLCEAVRPSVSCTSTRSLPHSLSLDGPAAFLAAEKNGSWYTRTQTPPSAAPPSPVLTCSLPSLQCKRFLHLPHGRA